MFNFHKSSSNNESSVSTPPNANPTIKKTPSFSLDTTDVTHSSVFSESLIQYPSVFQINEFLDLNTFKTQPCPTTFQHNYKNCTFFHNFKDRRRPGEFYSSELCKYLEVCPLGDQCLFSHNYIEQMYQRDKYKTKFCGFYPNNLKQCEYGSYCCFAHSENEFLIDLIHNYEFDEDFYMFHYKTVWCPFNLNTHDKSQCVYAHNWQDFRRKPHLFDYEEKGCGLWKYNEVLLEYNQGCPNGLNCNFSHGWKEFEFHPFNYKLKNCIAGNNCSKGLVCPFFHSIKDKRVLSISLLCKQFKLHPRNRILANTFKIRTSKTYGTLGLSHHGSLNYGNKSDFLGSILEEDQNQKYSMIYSKKNKEKGKMKGFTPNHKYEFKGNDEIRRSSENLMEKKEVSPFFNGNNKKF